ncbi:MAG: putative selenium-dependent hydroxylase accessory protein YqeC [Spirochaetaceae bacterium]|nr:putative selenium-dependent hydroxylase accessory protein YqeC [Spirochaetaceae bacterium]
MEALSAWFAGLRSGSANREVITVIGSGGKTSLIWLLAKTAALGGECRSVLVSPTTRMLVPPREAGLWDHFFEGPDRCQASAAPSTGWRAASGITLAGLVDTSAGKLKALPEAALAALVPGYDLVLLEGDGSRTLPLKAWADFEPVVPDYTGLTVGILPLWPLGRGVSEDLVHRLSLFTVLSGAAPGEVLNLDHLVRVITGRGNARGLFAAARGDRVLFFNQVEDEAGVDMARQMVSRLPPSFRSSLRAIIAGSVRQDRVFAL